MLTCSSLVLATDLFYVRILNGLEADALTRNWVKHVVLIGDKNYDKKEEKHILYDETIYLLSLTWGNIYFFFNLKM